MLHEKNPKRLNQKMRFIFLCLILLGFARLSAQARLGESEQQLVKRFGKATLDLPANGGVSLKQFSTQGFTILVTIINGLSESESYTPNRGYLTETEVNHLLDVNREGQKWTRQQDSLQDWARSDGGSASYAKGGLTIRSKVWRDKLGAIENQLLVPQKSIHSSIEGF